MPMDISQSIVTTLVTIGELFVVNSEKMQDCRIKIVDVYRISDDIVAVIVGLTESDTTLYTSTSKQDSEAARMMVTSVIRGGEFAL